MARKLLIALLVIALLFELGLTGMAFFSRAATLHQLGMLLNPQTDFLGYLVAWFCLFVSLVCGLALWQVINKQKEQAMLCYLLGLWWAGIGIGIYVCFKRPDNLLTDTLKGSLLLLLTWLHGRQKK